MQEVKDGIYGELQNLNIKNMLRQQEQAQKEGKESTFEIITSGDFEMARQRVGKEKTMNGNKRKKARRSKIIEETALTK